jgi:NosR/NirI family nitrous oxide reductase transcriptional regulator
MKFPNFYFRWLQQGNPTGTVDRYPELSGYASSIPGIYCVGDLTGVPLIKLAAESGHEIVDLLHADTAFQNSVKQNAGSDVYDLLVVGAGPAGMAAALRAKALGYRSAMIESAQAFNTILNFPKGKPIYVTPVDPPMKSGLAFGDGSKETLLDELHAAVEGQELELHQGDPVSHIDGRLGAFEVKTTKATYNALRVVVAIGKSGNARQLGVPGETLPKVFTRLIDPGEHQDRDILVVGGGDSAIEAAVSLADAGNRVSLSYRKSTLSRPKEHNLAAYEARVSNGSIRSLLGSQVLEIREADVVVRNEQGEQTLPNDVVYALIGSEIPVAFFKRSRIRMEGERDAAWWVFLTAMVSFFTMLYFGKSGVAIDLFSSASGAVSHIAAYLSAPLRVSPAWGLTGYAWYSALNFYLGWLGSLIFIFSGSAALYFMVRDPERYFGSWWLRIKSTYLTSAAVLFLWVYFSALLSQDSGWAEEPVYWYSFFYTTTIILFGIRRMVVKPTRYIIYQTLTLMFVQAFFLFLLPFYLYEGVLVKLISPESGFIREVFPHGKWSSFGLILFWPLNINDFGASRFWTWFPFIQTFGILFVIVKRWGKGVYCGWICSCGAMAETLGDEYRTLAPHGPRAKKYENIGQVVLWVAVIATALHLAASHGAFGSTLIADTVWGLYKILIDVLFAGVLGLGVYFFMGGRVWCRFGCPLAALMHLYTRFSPYRIMANKKRCISCNVCTKVCHMGIDVMGYANRGVPMNDVECVRCSACVVNCPMQVLTFGSVEKSDPGNERYKAGHMPLVRDWSAGLPDADLQDRLADEASKGTLS